MLFSRKETTKLHTKFARRSQLINEDCWNHLIVWFGGGKCVRLKCLRKGIKPKGKLLRVVCQDSNNQFKRMLVNSDIIIEDLKKEICESYELEEEKCRLHDFYKSRVFGRLDKLKNLQLPLRQIMLIHDNIVFLETADGRGEFEITYEKKH